MDCPSQWHIDCVTKDLEQSSSAELPSCVDTDAYRLDNISLRFTSMGASGKFTM